MADSRYRNYAGDRSGSPPKWRPDSRPSPSPRPGGPRPHTAYPDVWTADRDPYHRNRVEIFNKRRESVVSRSQSRSGTPLKPDNRRPGTRIEKHRPTSSIKSPATGYLEKNWRKVIPSVKDKERQLMSPPSSSIDTHISASSCASPVELQDELDRYSVESEYLLTRNEWVSPPEPRARCRRMNAQEFNAEKVRVLKRWNIAESIMYGLQSSTLRDTDAKQPREAYRPGVIFSAPLHTAVTTDEMYIANDDPNLTATPFGTLNSKFRKMIVYRNFGEHLQCIPIYTHNGKGLEGKDFLHEFKFEGPHRGIYASRDSSYKGTFIIGKAVVKLTERYTHRYDAPATIEGKIAEWKDQSHKRLFDLIPK
ncbi:hypothetical protein F5B19DRAFT_487062 [Rostrohypoxylon terebratum]|nr:hypothetical protein F5B19DRAFT_487062 [Rostrohypoxylon terebratum]